MRKLLFSRISDFLRPLAARSRPRSIGHVFVINLENEDYASTWGASSPAQYLNGTLVKQGTTLFTIEPETYKLKLEQAQAAEAGSQASLKQAETDYKRQAELVARQAVSQATLDTSTSNRDNAQANLQQAQANTKIAAINYGYTDVVAPFDGIVVTAAPPRIQRVA